MATSASPSPSLALETGAPISVGDFRVLNRCLDDAIASAVTEYGREHPLLGADISAPSERERVGFLVHEIRNLVNAATVAFEVLNTGNVGVSGSTGAVLKRSLSGLRDLINRAVAEVRLGQGLQDRVTIGVAEFIDELTPAALLEAANRGLRFTVHAADANVAVQADRQILSAIVTNLLQNAFKFTRPRTSVSLRVIASADRVLIEIEDECGGLADGNAEALFQPFERRSADRTGLGLGLAFSRWGAEVNGGRISTRNLRDTGACSASTCRGCQCPFSRRRDARHVVEREAVRGQLSRLKSARFHALQQHRGRASASRSLP